MTETARTDSHESFGFACTKRDGKTYFVGLHTSGPPSAAAWSAYVDELAAAAVRTAHVIPILVVTDGGAPNATQRREFAAAIERASLQPLAHIFSDDVVVRGVVTAFHWLLRTPFVAHAPGRFAWVCASCGLAPEQVLSDLTAVQKTMPAVATLQRVMSPPKRSSLHPRS